MSVDSSNEVKPADVARHYIKSELGHVLGTLEKQITKSIDIDNMTEQEVFALCEALSIFYRLNSVWWIVADPKFKWHEAKVPVGDVQMTGMGDTEISRLIDSPGINKDPIRLREFLQNYYANLGSGEDKYEVRPTGKSIGLNTVLLIKQNNELKLLDGSHRFIEQLLADETSVNAYIATSTQPDESIRPAIGGGVYRDLLRVLEYEKGEDQQEKIREIAKLLSKYSGRDKEPLKCFPDLIDEEEQ